MALQEQHVAYKFAGGVETKMDSKAVPAARLLTLENGVFTRAISIRKRNGYEALSRSYREGDNTLLIGTDTAHGRRLAKRSDELLMFVDNVCVTNQSDEDQWIAVDNVYSTPGTERSVVRTGTQQTMPDHATVGDVSVFAWEDSRGGVWWTVCNATTGAVYRAAAQADANAQRPRCVAVGNLLHMCYAVPATRQVRVIVINPNTPTLSTSALVLVDDLSSTNPVYDICPTTRTGTPAAIAWAEHATTNFRLGYVDISGVLGSPATGHPSVLTVAAGMAAASPIAVAYGAGTAPNDELGVACVVGANLALSNYSGGNLATPIAPLTSGTTAVTSITRVACVFTAGAGSKLYAVAEETAANASERYCRVARLSGGFVIAGGSILSVGLASRAFQAGIDDVFAYFVHDTTYFNVYVALDLDKQVCVARQVVGGATGAPTRTHLSSAVVRDNVVYTCLPRKERVASENNDKFGEYGLQMLTIDFDSRASHQTAQLGRGLYMAGACPQHYDGSAWAEAGFHVGPELISTVKAGGGSMTPSSTYLYKVWYECTDAQGEVHRGPESAGTSVVMGGGDTQVTLTLPTLRITNKSNVRICVARSLPGDTAQLFRVTSLDPTQSGAAANGYVANDATINSVSFVDRMSDTDLRKQQPHYTNGGILSNDPTPFGSHIAVGKNRIFYTDSENGNIVRFSQRLAEGFAVEFAPELKHDVDPLGGDITALAVMDDVVFVFKASAIYAFNGDGPYENGGSTSGGLVAGFSSSQLITSDVGCTEPASMVLTPNGLMFQSAKGIWLLDRSRQVSYVGAAVEAYNAQIVTSADVLPGRSQVVFLTASGSALLYDYLFGQWSTFTNHEGLDAIVVDDTYHYLRNDSRVFRETIGQHADDGARITLRFETAWLHLVEHLQGFQRFWKLLLLGTWSSPHQLGISHRLNYDEAWSEPYWLDATGEDDPAGWITGDSANPVGEDPITGSVYGDGDYGDGPYGGTGPDVYQWRYGIHENGQSVQFRFEDFEKSGLAGASFELTEMTIVGGVKKPDIRPFSGARST